MKSLETASVLVLVALILLPAAPAQAYLDPSTGSMLLSALVSLVVTSWLALQAYGHRIVGFMRRHDRPVPDDEQAPAGEGPGGP